MNFFKHTPLKSVGVLVLTLLWSEHALGSRRVPTGVPGNKTHVPSTQHKSAGSTHPSLKKPSEKSHLEKVHTETKAYNPTANHNNNHALTSKSIGINDVSTQTTNNNLTPPPPPPPPNIGNGSNNLMPPPPPPPLLNLVPTPVLQVPPQGGGKGGKSTAVPSGTEKPITTFEAGMTSEDLLILIDNDPNIKNGFEKDLFKKNLKKDEFKSIIKEESENLKGKTPSAILPYIRDKMDAKNGFAYADKKPDAPKNAPVIDNRYPKNALGKRIFKEGLKTQDLFDLPLDASPHDSGPTHPGKPENQQAASLNAFKGDIIKQYGNDFWSKDIVARINKNDPSFIGKTIEEIVEIAVKEKGL
jgi:hypothetical protein